MKRFFTLSVIFASAVLTLSSCSKQYNNTSVTSGTGNGTWTWSGTAPFSAKIDGKQFATNAASVSIVPDSSKGPLDFAFTVADTSGTTIMIGLIGSNYKAGDEINFPYPAACDIIRTNPNVTAVGISGKMKILQDDGNYISGLFYVTTSSQSIDTSIVQQHDTTVTLSQGFFRVAKK
jgi:hypothetical protein